MSEGSRRQVHIHLDTGRSFEEWAARFAESLVRESTPYGYGALRSVYEVTSSRDLKAGRLVAVLQRVVRKTLGMDLIHAWWNRSALRKADVVITHTEVEFLAALLVLWVMRDRRDKVLCQAVWLWDRWQHLTRARRCVYKQLMSRALVLTTLSPDNLTVARTVMPDRPSAFVPFGVRPFPPFPDYGYPRGHRARFLAAGNDADRDWATLVSAAYKLTEVGPVNMRVRSASPAALRAFSGTQWGAEPAEGFTRFLEDMRWCDVVVIPLRRNLHASGITVALESLSAGRAVVIADTGGVRTYLGDLASYYIAGDADSLAKAMVQACRLADLGTSTSAVAGLGLTSDDYAFRHVTLIEGILRYGEVPEGVSRLESVVPPALSE